MDVKALVVLTDGEDRGSMETLARAIAAAQRAETVIYAIRFKSEQHGYGGHHGGGYGGRGGYPGGGQRGGENHPDGKKVLEQITGETGGRMFEVSGKQTFTTIYTQIAEELRSQYRLGYTPDAATAAGGFHRVDLTVPKDKKLIVQTPTATTPGIKSVTCVCRRHAESPQEASTESGSYICPDRGAQLASAMGVIV